MSLNRKLFAALLLAVQVGACAAPDMRNLVFEKFGPEATMISEADSLPRPAYSSNRFRYPPGSIFRPSTSIPADWIFGKAGVIQSIDAECFQRAFSLAHAKRTRLPKEELSYNFDFSIGLPGFNRGLEAFKNDFELKEIPPNVIASIHQVNVRLSNVRTYEASERQIALALKSITTGHAHHRRLCTILDGGMSNALVVKRIYVANIRTRIRWDQGFSGRLGRVWESRIQKSIRHAFNGNRIVFAVATDPATNTQHLSILRESRR